MVSGAEAIIRPIAASHWWGSARERTAGSSPGSTTAVPERHAAGLDPHPGLGLQVADVVGLRAVRGDQPEDVTVQAVSQRGAPASPVRRPVVSSSANARGAKPTRRARRITRLLPSSSVVTTRYFRERIPRFYRSRRTL